MMMLRQSIAPTNTTVPKKKVAVIGAGVSGLTAAKTFAEKGHTVVGFERSNNIGGVWDPNRAYPGVKTQSPKDLYRYTDFAMPDEYPEWPYGTQVQEYLKSYAEKHDLMRLFRFEATVSKLEWRIDGKPGWVLTIMNKPSSSMESASGEESGFQMVFDFVVICTGTFTNPKHVSHPGQIQFLEAGGIVKHSSDYKDLTDADLKGKHVVVIGGSKSATDIIVNASERGATQVTMLYKRNLWRIPYFLGGINLKHLLYAWIQELQFPSWKNYSLIQRVFFLLATPFIWANFRMLELILTVQLGLKKWNMRPQERIEDSVCCEIPSVTEGMFEAFQRGDVQPIQSTLNNYEVEHGVATKYLVLSCGKKVKADIVIQATGWTTDLSFLPEEVMKDLIDPNDGLFRLYRFAVNPALPNLGFVGFNSSFCTVLSSEMIAHWLLRYADGMLVRQPTNEEMERNIDHMLEWKRSIFPAAKVYHGNCVAPFHFLHFDEILSDMGARSKNSAMFCYPDADKFGGYLKSAPKYTTA